MYRIFSKSVFLFLLFLLPQLLAQTAYYQENKQVEVFSKMREDKLGYDLYAKNSHIIDVYLVVQFPSLQNLTSTETIPFHSSIPKLNEKVFLMSLLIKDPQRSYGYNISYTYSYGNPNTVLPDSDYLYWFPFAHGTKHKITQGFHGVFSHKNDNEYAVDFDLVTGTPVYAARAGVVVDVKQDSRVGGKDARYATFANYILVQHDDGTFGNYVHLRYGSSLVQPGDSIAAGQHIAFSGNTGLSSGPHLHFDVRIPTPDGKMQSIPIAFLGVNQERTEPLAHQYYYAYHPGNTPFTPIYGRDLVPEDFSEHRVNIPVTNRFDTRTEQIDNTYIMFFQNGYQKDFSVTITMKIRNMTPSASFPLTFTAPAQTELFVSLLRADPKARHIYYAPTITYSKIE